MPADYSINLFGESLYESLFQFALQFMGFPPAHATHVARSVAPRESPRLIGDGFAEWLGLLIQGGDVDFASTNRAAREGIFLAQVKCAKASEVCNDDELFHGIRELC